MVQGLSAFAAKKVVAEVEEDEEIVIKYTVSSDEDDSVPMEVVDSIPAIAAGTPIMPNNIPQNRSTGIKPITVSNFKPNKDNLIFHDDFVTIALKNSEYLLIKGQYKLIIQRGCLKIDTVPYHASPEPIEIIALTLISLPVLYSDQVTDRSIVSDTRTEHNEHLFTSEYKTVVQLMNHYTGLEDIAKIYPPLKNIFPNYDQDEFVTSMESEFSNYSFQPVFHDQGMNSSLLGTLVPKNWTKHLDSITEEIINDNENVNNDNQPRVMVIGGKNSGKSTFLKQLLNQLLYKFDNCIPINVMDLDPGQTEYSIPDSISLSSITSPLIGFNVTPLRDDNDILVSKYVGYLNPNRQPQRYEKLCLDMCEYYDKELSGKNQPLLINTPGWIKGYGVELLRQLTELLNPTHLLFLSPVNSNIDLESELFQNLTYEKLIPVNGFINSINVKYSAAQLRIFKILSYFHNTQFQKKKPGFDFTPLILSHSPYKVSFNDSDSLLFPGISLVIVLTSDNGNIKQEDLVDCLEAVVCGIYTLDLDTYQNLLSQLKIGHLTGFPNLIDANEVQDLLMNFKGLGLVHSVDLTNKTINMYTPINTSALQNDDELVVLVRGRTEMPIEEIAPKEFIKQQAKSATFPYVTFDKMVGVGGKVLKVRRNVMRRGHM